MTCPPETGRPDLAEKSTTVLHACRTRLLLIDADCQGDAAPWLEYVCLKMLAQMGEVGRAVSLVAENEQDETLTHPVASGLARLAVEGLAYMNYMLTRDDPEWYARWFSVGDIMWRENFEDARQNKRWRRHHGQVTRRKKESLLDAGHSLTLPLEDDDVLCLDQFEKEWLRRAHTGLTRRGINMRTPPLGDAPVWDWRNWWNSHTCTSSETDSNRTWQERNRCWNESRLRPFGVRFDRAVRDGNLLEFIDGTADAEKPAVDMREWIPIFGWGVGSNLAHFNSTRTFVASSVFARSACSTVLCSLWLAVRMLADRRKYVWASALVDKL